MTARSKIGLIALLGVIVVGVLLVLRQNLNQNVPLTATSPAPAAATSTTSQLAPIVTATSAPFPTMTAEEQRVMEYVKGLNPQSQASSPDQCPTILQTQPWCSLIGSAKRITRSEWDELLPQTQFFVVEYALIGQEGGQVRHVLVAEQNGQHYDATTFDQLLDANGIVITDTNRELVAKAFALTTLSDYLEQDITFSNLTQGDWDAGFKRRFTLHDHRLDKNTRAKDEMALCVSRWKTVACRKFT